VEKGWHGAQPARDLQFSVAKQRIQLGGSDLADVSLYKLSAVVGLIWKATGWIHIYTSSDRHTFKHEAMRQPASSTEQIHTRYFCHFSIPLFCFDHRMKRSKPADSKSIILAPTFYVSSTSRSHPLVDLFRLELPKPTNSVRRHVPLTNPCINGVFAHAEVLGDLFDRQPAI
jgi:hypothetical protein